MTIELFAAFCVAEAVLCLTPGPAVFLVTSVALRHGVKGGVGTALGVVTANVLYFALSATGISAVLMASHELFVALKWIGGAYLVWIGLRLIFRRHVLPPGHTELQRGFSHGLIVQGANPKAIVFFIAFLPQFLDPARPLMNQLLALGAASVVIELAALFIYARAAQGTGRAIGPGMTRAIERLGGGVLVVAGVRLATIRQS